MENSWQNKNKETDMSPCLLQNLVEIVIFAGMKQLVAQIP